MKKVLVWDGDNTLWNGTIAEDGIDNITLPSNRYDLCKILCERGVVQSIASYNNYQDVLLALEKFNLTNFFIVPQASFDITKADMILKIQEELNISKLSDIVFLDDQQFNIEEVKYTLSDVISEYYSAEKLDEIIIKYFSKSSYTETDINRVRRYKEEQIRKEASKSYNNDYQSFLKQCSLELEISNACSKDIDNIDNLIIRANRMSILAEPITKQTIIDNLNNFYIAHVKDKFGDYGLSGIIYFKDGVIRGLVISCRMQGKGIGSAFLGTFINTNLDKEISIMYKETDYNQGMKSLMNWYKFNNTNEDDKIKFYKTFDTPVNLPDWVKIMFKLNSNGVEYRKAKLAEYDSIINLVQSSNDPILSTFKSLWDERGYWSNYIPVVAVKDNKIIGVHAYTINSDKYSDVCKSYYMIVDSCARGLGIGGNLFLYAIIDSNMNKCYTYYTNSADTNDGYRFYINFGIKPYEIKENEFGSKDYFFKMNIKGIFTFDNLLKRIKEVYNV